MLHSQGGTKFASQISPVHVSSIVYQMEHGVKWKLRATPKRSIYERRVASEIQKEIAVTYK